jgi:uncharacterized protein YceK
MRRRVAVLLVAVLAPAAGGCGTAANTLWLDDFEGGQKVYGGVGVDATMFASAVADCDGKGPALSTAWALFFAADMPLSAVADTVTLPYTITATLMRPATPDPQPRTPEGKLWNPQSAGATPDALPR